GIVVARERSQPVGHAARGAALAVEYGVPGAAAEHEPRSALHAVDQAEGRPRALGKCAADGERVVESQGCVVAQVDAYDRELDAVAIPQLAVRMSERAQVLDA